jgi:hypothetical protein
LSSTFGLGFGLGAGGGAGETGGGAEVATAVGLGEGVGAAVVGVGVGAGVGVGVGEGPAFEGGGLELADAAALADTAGPADAAALAEPDADVAGEALAAVAGGPLLDSAGAAETVGLGAGGGVTAGLSEPPPKRVSRYIATPAPAAIKTTTPRTRPDLLFCCTGGGAWDACAGRPAAGRTEGPGGGGALETGVSLLTRGGSDADFFCITDAGAISATSA